MENFGYLAKNVDNSEALYSQDAIEHAIKKVQKFGAIPETGYLDTKTLQLMSSPRCGVADVTPGERRSRRYVIGSLGWKKRTITYL
jgi:Putative peptidoglycan binding domain